MSNYSYIRFPVDPTGKSPDNLVAGERRVMEPRKRRVVVPNHAYFYADSMRVYDAVTMRPLVKGVDFVIAHYHQEAMMRYGQSVAAVVVITNEAVSAEVLMDYQVVGGTLVVYHEEVKRMYDLIMADNRPIDWVNVENKPLEFNPSLHKHLLSEIVGFEPVVFQLERVANAIVLNNIPSFEALIDFVTARYKEPANDQEVLDASPVDKFITMKQMLLASQHLNFNSLDWGLESRMIRNGSILNVKIDSSNIEDNGLLYWSIEHISTQADDFYGSDGSFVINDKTGSFTVQVKPNRTIKPELEEKFRIVLRRSSPQGNVISRSPVITIAKYTGFYEDAVMAAITCCLANPSINVNATTYYLMGE